MQKLIPVLILSLGLIGCSKKKEERPLDKMLGEKQKKEQGENYEVGTTEPAEHYQRGFDAYKDIKEIRKEEQDRQEEQKQTMDDVDNQ
ncbi:hypothetical protein L0244_19775 [bacterium]|nr:hypothetical protein [bacterium]MCI0615236.1 hypothetical protein [bacterium]